MGSRVANRLLALIVGAVLVIGIAISIDQYFFHEPYNPGFLEFPGVVRWHVLLGLVYLGLAPWQFVARIRQRHVGYHRWAGRGLLAIGVPVGVTALFIGLLIPFSGWPERVVIGAFGTFFLFALTKAFLSIRAGHIALHREWMIRAFAIALGIASMRVIYVIGLIVQGKSIHTADASLSIAAFTTAFVLHAIIAEIWIRRGVRAPVK